MHIQFAELPVYDQDRAIAFYTAHFGCRVAADVPMGPDGWRWVELALPGAVTTLHQIPRADEHPATEPTLVLVTDDVWGTTAALEAAEVTILAEPHAALWDAGKTVATVRDSEGNVMMLSSP